MGRTGLSVLLGVALLAVVGAAVFVIFGEEWFAPARAVPAHIKPGYVGITAFGRWRLICSAGAPASPGARPQSNECRINHEVTDRAHPRQIILAVNLGAAGNPKRTIAMFRLPPTAQSGDTVLLRADNSTRARVPVTACSATECVAGGPIADDEWERLLDARSLQIAFPARNRQRVLVNVPVDGLADAAHAMTVAQK